jgi:acetyltransferase-like isoleucine patch superfamily enzyme
MPIVRSLLRSLALRHAFARDLYRRLFQPDGTDWAALLRARGDLHAIGEHCSIQTNVTITDPAFVSLGNNVRLSGCTLFCHDGSINMIKRAYGIALDRFGKLEIRDNVFIGHGAIVLPGVTIGPNAVVAAGAVVSRDVEPNSVYGGVPAKRLCSLDEMVERMRREYLGYPWRELLEDDPSPSLATPDIDRLRAEYFFGPERKRA